MRSFVRRVEEARSSLRATCQTVAEGADTAAALEGLHSAVQGAFEGSADVGADLELVFRGLLDGLLERAAVSGDSAEAFRLIAVAVDFALKYPTLSPTLPKIPFLLIEDLLESQTIEKAEATWSTIESMVDKLTHPDLFAKGKFVVLKFCNSLLRKLSKSCNAAFSGRILMFLAAIYPISERSAVNLPGKINSSNVTYFEDEATFNATIATIVANAESMTTEGSAASSSGSSAKPNAKNKQPVKAAEDGEEMEEEAGKGKGDIGSGSGKAGGAADGANILSKPTSYETYKSFWELQAYFASENKTIETIAVWREFVAHAKNVIVVFEGSGFSDEEISQAVRDYNVLRRAALRSSSSSSSSSDGVDQSSSSSTTAAAAAAPQSGKKGASTGRSKRKYEEAMEAKQTAHTTEPSQSEVDQGYMGCKFLTSSQLFALQLRDPQLRQQVAAQMLYFVQYLKLNPLPFTDPAITAEVLKDMVYIHNRSKTILERAPPNGGDVVAALQQVLFRESQWIQWKVDSCPPFDKPFASAATENGAAAVSKPTMKLSDFFTKYYKRQSSRGGSARAVAADASTHPFVYEFDTTMEKVKMQAQSLVAELPLYEDQLQLYIDAEDPDQGIEEEYHPKHDHVYCWRTRRLMAAKNLAAFEAMYDGDIAKSFAKQDTPAQADSSEESVNEGKSDGAAAEEDGDAIAVDGMIGQLMEDGETMEA